MATWCPKGLDLFRWPLTLVYLLFVYFLGQSLTSGIKTQASLKKQPAPAFTHWDCRYNLPCSVKIGHIHVQTWPAMLRCDPPSWGILKGGVFATVCEDLFSEWYQMFTQLEWTRFLLAWSSLSWSLSFPGTAQASITLPTRFWTQLQPHRLPHAELSFKCILSLHVQSGFL